MFCSLLKVKNSFCSVLNAMLYLDAYLKSEIRFRVLIINFLCFTKNDNINFHLIAGFIWSGAAGAVITTEAKKI